MSRRILSFALFEAKSGLTREQEEFLNKYTNGAWTLNPSTGLVDVEGDFVVKAKEDIESFGGVKFGKVDGDFSCSHNRLTSLEGAPQEVGGDFDCSWNKLTSLAGAPLEVGGYFDCLDNRLTSLEGSPQVVGGYFDCSWNKLTSLAGAPQVVGGYFDCDENKLTSLAGAPQEVGGRFRCDAFTWNGEWNLNGWLKLVKKGSPEAQKLVLTLLPAEALNKEIQKDPTGMIMKLREIWNDQNFKEIRSKLIWPKGYGEEAGLVGDLDDVGF